MTDKSLFAQIRARMPVNRDRVLAHLPDRGGHHYTYRDVLEVAAGFAHVLVSLGIRPGDRVACQAEKSIEALMLYLAALRAGAVYLPLNPAYTPAEIEYFLSDAKPAKWFKLNAEYARVWPNITVKKEPLADAKEWEGMPDKFDNFFSPNPGAGD